MRESPLEPGRFCINRTCTSEVISSFVIWLDGADARAVYNYIGSGRLKQKTLLNGASTVSTYKLLYNGVGQITSALYRNAADTATIIGYEHGYDKMGNPQYEIRTHQSSEGDAYMYDNLYRVTRTIYDDSTPRDVQKLIRVVERGQ